MLVRGAAAVRAVRAASPPSWARWACACAAGGALPRPLAGTAPTYDVHFLVQLPPGGDAMLPKGGKTTKEATTSVKESPAAGGGPSPSPFDPGWPRVIEGTPAALAVLSGIAQHAADYRPVRKRAGGDREEDGKEGGGGVGSSNERRGSSREAGASSQGEASPSSPSSSSSSSSSSRSSLLSVLPTFKLTAYHVPPRSLAASFLPPAPAAGHANLIVLPQGDVYASLTHDSLFSVASYVAESARRVSAGDDDRLPEAVASRPFPRPPFGPSFSLSPRALLMLVCVHGTRDARCGSLGGGAADALEREAKKAQARLQGDFDAAGRGSASGSGSYPGPGAWGPPSGGVGSDGGVANRGSRLRAADLAGSRGAGAFSSLPTRSQAPARRFNRSPAPRFASPSVPALFPRGHSRRPVLGRFRDADEDVQGAGRGAEGENDRHLMGLRSQRLPVQGSTFAKIPTSKGRGQDEAEDGGREGEVRDFEASNEARLATRGHSRPRPVRPPPSSSASSSTTASTATPPGPPQLAVLGVSHVGGHKYAGNVIVSCPAHPCDGDWFGHVEAGNARDFLDALLTSEIGSRGGVENPRLRELWRGRAGLDKETQQELYHIFRNAQGDE